MNMPQAATQIHPVIYAVACPFDGVGLVQVYVVVGRRTAIIDTGVADSPDAYIAPALEAVGLSLDNVDYILNTHGHGDHIGGNHRVKERSHAQVMIHAADAPFITDPSYAVDGPISFVQIAKSAGLPNAAQIESAARAGLGAPAKVDRVLHDGDTIDLGNNIVLRVVHTPGHSAGSVCFYWQHGKVLFSGDSIQIRGARQGTLPLYFLANDYKASMRRLQGLDIDLLCLGHNFNWSRAYNVPQRRGADAQDSIAESIGVAETMERAVNKALEGRPDAGFLEIIPAVVDELTFDIPVLRDRTAAGGLAHRSMAALWAHWNAAQGD
jgi:glyoxylase-like metal-dependent hydrolase (beta-lactamase superfamily II)